MWLAVILATISIAAAQTRRLPPDFAERLVALEQARQAQPNDLQVLDALAGSYAMAAEYRKAIAVLKQMQTLNPEDPGLQLRLARNYAWSGGTGHAIAEYNSYLNAARQDRQATIELIRLRRYRGDYSQAEELCNRLLSTNPDDASTGRRHRRGRIKDACLRRRSRRRRRWSGRGRWRESPFVARSGRIDRRGAGRIARERET